MTIHLIEIVPNMEVGELSTDDPSLLRDVVAASSELYRKTGHHSPWVCYLAEDSKGDVVGTCGFKSPPCEGEVEIAYFTFPTRESKGIATEMARMLIGIASQTDPKIRITAQTLPDRNASHRVLEKAGFEAGNRIIHPEDGEVLVWKLPDPTD